MKPQVGQVILRDGFVMRSSNWGKYNPSLPPVAGRGGMLRRLWEEGTLVVGGADSTAIFIRPIQKPFAQRGSLEFWARCFWKGRLSVLQCLLYSKTLAAFPSPRFSTLWSSQRNSVPRNANNIVHLADFG